MRSSIWLFVVQLHLIGCTGASAPTAPPKILGNLDSARLAAASTEPDNWFTPGRDGAGTYYSPLDRIDTRTIANLGFAWEYPLGTQRGIEATPIVIDGVLFTSSNWGRVYALDARTGVQLWTYEPDVDGQWGRYPCCDIVNRGVAVWNGRVYVGALDGWLFRKTRPPLWSGWNSN